ncbi:pyridine nucleotide transhydrogenase [Pseudomonas fluorescens]|uniref:pyridine nucleotide transhydrogenase n=1 Tax=Pseudomonas fluorescens TaxID=294 RepID=UPI002ACA9E0F|nr:pyridine nucleotide transhydrogenase [Pseudomonas fluorescens]MDZ5434241.1 pyridine nucleotide transhydrogenase [Pseudomonas fluorescens]
MTDALIGSSGFVGSTLLNQTKFDFHYRSTNIQEIDGKSFDTVVCAAAPAQKWIANQNPEKDREIIETLIGHLNTIKCNYFILISTVDVFSSPIGVNEASPINEESLLAYGLNRRYLEKFVEQHFEHHLIVRLPGLVGPGLRKNVIYDFQNDNNIQNIDSRAVFQFYPMVNLWADINIAREANINIIHLTAKPISVSDVSKFGFGKTFENHCAATLAEYDMQTQHADIYGISGSYQYGAHETIHAIRSYNQYQQACSGKGL